MSIENLIKKSYIKKAKRKLTNFKGKKIAITGSFGKTSTKNILFEMLNKSFRVCKTPQSFNTPMGICRAVLENLDENDDFFIVEMGARKSGDIRELADFVGVDYGILTPIGCCHLESFGTIEKIENTKFELCENVKKFCIFNGKSDSTKRLFDRYTHKKYLVCVPNSFAYAKNLKFENGQTSFDFVIGGQSFHCKTRLLGASNVDNIVVAGAMAYLLGMGIVDIKNAILSLSQSPHRLELISGFVTVIDDSYNSNFAGFCEALTVLSGFSGRKIVVSPGMVELGTKQFEQNQKIAEKIAKVADIFVIMNDCNRPALLSGAKNGGMKKDNIFFANSRKSQQELLKKIIKKGDIVLFENDLPDNYK